MARAHHARLHAQVPTQTHQLTPPASAFSHPRSRHPLPLAEGAGGRFRPVSARLYLATDDIRADVERLRERGVEIVDEPQLIYTDDGTFGSAGSEVWLAGFKDSEGNVLCLIT
ncbi:VOC family protein [Nonomuraea sp. NPDC049152]|uniref:VOC family protein n=1 Tax=Nonomuraea sp. NPDC049152 TaxID=3154350 RepID=UPI0033E01F94